MPGYRTVAEARPLVARLVASDYAEYQESSFSSGTRYEGYVDS